MKQKGRLMGDIMLMTTAFIWGTAFVAQRAGMEHIGPLTFMATRYMLAVISIGIVAYLYFCMNKKKYAMSLSRPKHDKTTTIVSGLVTGSILFVASSMQQTGLVYSSAGKVGFITALYIIIVPILGIFFKKRVGPLTWLGVVLATVGLYLLTMKEGLSMEYGDFIVLMASFIWAVHILVIDYYSNKVEPLYMSFLQFFVAMILSSIAMFLWEKPEWSGIWDARVSIFYAGVFSAGVGYTLQMIAQKNTDPTIASLILSLEAVFGALGGYFLLNEVLSTKELIGCVVMFIAILIAQIPDKKTQSIFS